MNKRYIDFVPAKSVKKPEPQPIPAAKPASAQAGHTRKAPAAPAKPQYVVEKTEIEIIKARKISDHSLKTPSAPVKAPITPATTTEPKSKTPAHEPFNIETMKPVTPAQPQFINTAAIKKRPLSKNVYKKPLAEPAKEEPAATITIIDRPKKESKLGLAITIVLTIIFGAAVGTVAFLLLPK